MYLPCLGSHTTIWLLGSKQALQIIIIIIIITLVISFTLWLSWLLLATEMMGE